TETRTFDLEAMAQDLDRCGVERNRDFVCARDEARRAIDHPAKRVRAGAFPKTGCERERVTTFVLQREREASSPDRLVTRRVELPDEEKEAAWQPFMPSVRDRGGVRPTLAFVRLGGFRFRRAIWIESVWPGEDDGERLPLAIRELRRRGRLRRGRGLR